jgi:hypothetical protein
MKVLLLINDVNLMSVTPLNPPILSKSLEFDVLSITSYMSHLEVDDSI